MTCLEQKDHVERVLVVENDNPTLKLICDHLAADRFQVTGARSTDEATSHLEAVKFDMVLLALNSGDGLDTLRAIRGSENGAVSRVGVIILSGRSTERERVKGLGEGADDYIAKPFKFDTLAAMLRKWSGSRRAF